MLAGEITNRILSFSFRKFGSVWDDYCRKVRSNMIPYVF